MTLAQGPPDYVQAEPGATAVILVPYVPKMLHQETIDAVVMTGQYVKFEPIGADNPYGYGAAFERHWNLGSDLIVVEQDIVPPTGFTLRWAQCDHQFCSFGYQCDVPALAYGLGCARFTSKLQATVPSLGQQASRDRTGRPHSMHWKALNERVLSLCEHFGHPVHRHLSGAVHLHDYEGGRARAGA